MPFRARDEKLLFRFSQDGAPDAIDRGFGRDGAAIRSGIQRPQLGVRTEDELLHGLPCSLAHSPLRVVFSDSNFFFSFSETFGCKDHWTIAPPASRQAWPPTGMTGRQRPSSQGAHCSQRRPTFFTRKETWDTRAALPGSLRATTQRTNSFLHGGHKPTRIAN